MSSGPLEVTLRDMRKAPLQRRHLPRMWPSARTSSIKRAPQRGLGHTMAQGLYTAIVLIRVCLLVQPSGQDMPDALSRKHSIDEFANFVEEGLLG